MVELVSLRKTNEVAAYVRASMDRKGDRWTVETQLRKIRALAEAKDWKVVEVYDDNAVSATKKRRAGTRWAEMLEDARAGKFSMVVAVDMDRLLRSTKDLNTLIDLGLRVVTVDGEIDLSTADGEFRATMLAALARFEARRKAERQIRSNERRRAEGIPTSAWKAFGWTRDGELIEEEAAASGVAPGLGTAARTAGPADPEESAGPPTPSHGLRRRGRDLAFHHRGLSETESRWLAERLARIEAERAHWRQQMRHQLTIEREEARQRRAVLWAQDRAQRRREREQLRELHEEARRRSGAGGGQGGEPD